MKDAENCLDSQLWHACAGGMVQMASVNSKVYYFPQGHAEHANGIVDFSTRCIPSLIPCRVTSVKFMADQESDEVYAKIGMTPLRPDEMDLDEEDDLGLGMGRVDAQDKPTSFAKTLTQSDANNGGGFSVPRYCAETIFPRLDYSADPPVQTVLAKDVHGEMWKFRHIYRGTPRRHLLTTGWSTFVNQKKLVAGDSIVFLRTEKGDLCVGIRRAKRRGIGGGSENPSGWNSSNGNHGSFSVFPREEEKMMRVEGNGSNLSYWAGMRGKGRVRAESVVEAATLAANGQPFEVVYYPSASTPEFCVRYASVNAALRILWSPGMRFKMAFETEDCSRISWFMGTISSVQVADPIRWPNSPWRLLQVTWDEPDLLQNVKRVSPWLVEVVSNMSSIHLAPFSSPRKRPRIPQNPDFPFDGHFSTPLFPGNPIGASGNPLCCFPDSTPAGIQGARHAQFGQPLSDLHFNNLQVGLCPPRFHRLDHILPLSQPSTGLVVGNPVIEDNVSHVLPTGSSSVSMKKSSDEKPSHIVLFGKRILTEQKMSLSNSTHTVSPGATGNSSSGDNLEKTTNVSDGSGTAHNGHTNNSSLDRFQLFMDGKISEHSILKRKSFELSLETGHCKFLMENKDAGRTLDLFAFNSYEELYSRVCDMFGFGKSEMMNQVLYRDAAGVVKHIGEEPFSVFMKEARRLIILTKSSSNDIGRYSSNAQLTEHFSYSALTTYTFL